MTSQWSFHVDYYSYTLKTDISNKYEIMDNLADIHANETGMANIYESDDWKPGAMRRPYQVSLRSTGLGCSVYFGGQNTILFEHSGQGCQYLRKIGALDTLMAITGDSATRLDIACDLETDTTPTDFVSHGYSGNIRTRNDRKSGTGQTVTLGSWKSERFVNVYRYHEPHPRHKTLRVEFRLKRDYARNACKWILQYDASHVVSMLDNSYKFKSPEWSVKTVNERLPGKPDNKSAEGTLLWIIKQVAPAIRKLISSGVIDNPNEFFEKYFIPDHKQESVSKNDA